MESSENAVSSEASVKEVKIASDAVNVDQSSAPDLADNEKEEIKPVLSDFIKPQLAKPQAKDISGGSKQHKSSKQSKSSVKADQPLAAADLPYKEPSWGGSFQSMYTLEVIKTGSVVDNVDLSSKSFHVFGRLPACDIVMEHPSISRYHCVLQSCAEKDERHEQGWYLYDLDSTHGTWINKTKVKPSTFYRVRVGYVLKFGGSTRLYVLQGPDTDMETESDLTVSEIKEQRAKQVKEAEILRNRTEELLEAVSATAEKSNDDGCSWGMGDDAVEDTIQENPFALPEPEEEAHFDDPKKTLKGFFEREGQEMPEYDVQPSGRGEHKCRLTLPISSATGEPVIAEAVAGKKKEAIVACALEACKILDHYGVLRTATHEAHQVKKRDWEAADYYSSDEDIYLDRTGSIEMKRKQRMKRLKKDNNTKSETYDSLVEQLDSVSKEISDVENMLQHAKAASDALADDSLDALDAYMTAIKSGAMDMKTKLQLKRRLLELQAEQNRLQRLANVAKPASLPKLSSNPNKLPSATAPKTLPLIGKLKATSKSTLVQPAAPATLRERAFAGSSDEEEKEEEEEVMPAAAAAGDGDLHQETATSADTAPSSTSGTVAESQVEDRLTFDSDALTHSGSGADGTTQGQGQSVIAPVGDKKHQQEVPKKVNANVKAKSTLSHLPKSKVMSDKKLSKTYAEDPDYAVWLPPEGQSGDGKTKLNEKYGY